MLFTLHLTLTLCRVDNFIPGKMDELGIGYAKLREVNPSIIHASISGPSLKASSKNSC